MSDHMTERDRKPWEHFAGKDVSVWITDAPKEARRAMFGSGEPVPDFMAQMEGLALAERKKKMGWSDAADKNAEFWLQENIDSGRHRYGKGSDHRLQALGEIGKIAAEADNWPALRGALRRAGGNEEVVKARMALAALRCAYFGAMECLEGLEKQGWSASWRSCWLKRSSLFGAALGANEKAVKWLLDHGADSGEEDELRALPAGFCFLARGKFPEKRDEAKRCLALLLKKPGWNERLINHNGSWQHSNKEMLEGSLAALAQAPWADLSDLAWAIKKGADPEKQSWPKSAEGQKTVADETKIKPSILGGVWALREKQSLKKELRGSAKPDGKLASGAKKIRV